MHVAFSRVEHRPWPTPTSRWTWRQNWKDLLFAHWPLPASVLQPLVPDPLKVQEFEGTSWVGVVPFRMTGVMRRPLPDLPGVSAFPELNLRLYVEYAGRPGVWFLSLDASNRLAVWAARRWFHLPYFHARMSLTRRAEDVSFQSQRRNAGDSTSFSARYRPVSEPFEARPGTLEAFLVERYRLYAQDPVGQLYSCDVHHHPWPLQQAVGEVDANSLVQPHGLSVSGEPLLHFSRGVDVVVWSLTRLIAGT